MPKFNDKGLEIYIFLCLAQQLEAYSYSFTGVLQYEGKYRLKKFQHEAKRLMEFLNNSFNEDQVAADAKIFDDALRLIRDAEPDKKLELYQLLSAWTKGQVRVEQPTVEQKQEGYVL